MIEYRPLTDVELVRLWDSHVAENAGDLCWCRWRERFLSENRAGYAVSFGILIDGETVGEGTLLLSPAAAAVRGRERLCDGAHVANINALRIRPALEGQGHVSALLRCMEAYAVGRGCTRMTIGVEEDAARTRAIYHHLGYTIPIPRGDDDEEGVCYFAKLLTDAAK